MNKGYISVLVPIYNCQHSISRCIESLINQKYTKLQIILIDDGSTDNSLEICKQYEKKDKRIEVYSKRNGGVSEARNVGLQHVFGEYVSFVDADDYLESDMYDTMIDNMGFNIDMIICGFNNIYTNTGEIKKNYNISKEIQRNDAIKELLLNRYIIGALWNNLIRTECIQDTLFDIKYSIGEDLYFKYEILKKVKNVVLIPNVLYNYCISENNTMSKFNAKKWIQVVEISDKIFLDIKNNNPELIKYAQIKCFKSRCFFLRNCDRQDFNENIINEQIVKNFKKYFLIYIGCFDISIREKISTIIVIFKYLKESRQLRYSE